MFIVFEGLDGSGKSTQAKRLYEHFVSEGMKCLLSFAPTDSKLGSLARAVTKGEFSLKKEALALLFAADMYEHFTTKISPVLDDGGIVVCDRYYYSNIVYQGICEKSIHRIMDYNQQIMKHPPDIVFFLDTTPQVCLERLRATRKDISIYENLNQLETHYKRYQSLFDQTTDNIITIETSGKNEAVISALILHAYNATTTPPLLA